MEVPGTPLTFVSGEALDVPSQEQNRDQEEILILGFIIGFLLRIQLI